jgi:hypothetical protein
MHMHPDLGASAQIRGLSLIFAKKMGFLHWKMIFLVILSANLMDFGHFWEILDSFLAQI